MTDPYRTNARPRDDGDELSKEIRAFMRAWRPMLVGRGIVECVDPTRCTGGYGGHFHHGACRIDLGTS